MSLLLRYRTPAVKHVLGFGSKVGEVAHCNSGDWFRSMTKLLVPKLVSYDIWKDFDV